MDTLSDAIRATADTGVKYVVPLNPIDVSLGGQRAICNLLDALVGCSPDYNFDWAIKSNQGSLAKRLRSWVYRKKGKTLPDEVVEKIGYLANQHKAWASSLTIAFAKGIRWQRGDWGDPDSCYWTVKEYSRYALNTLPNTYAMLIYDDIGAAWGRTILLLDLPDLGQVTLFNSYPKGYQLVNSARVLVKWAQKYAGIPGLLDTPVDLLYDGAWNESLWINGGHGVVVHTGGQSPNNTIDLLATNLFRCSECHTSCYTNYRVRRPLPHTWMCLCSHCADQVTAICPYCQTRVAKEDMLPGGYCADCAAKRRPCANCGQMMIGVSQNIYQALRPDSNRGPCLLAADITLCAECMATLRTATYVHTMGRAQNTLCHLPGGPSYVRHMMTDDHPQGLVGILETAWLP